MRASGRPRPILPLLPARLLGMAGKAKAVGQPKAKGAAKKAAAKSCVAAKKAADLSATTLLGQEALESQARKRLRSHDEEKAAVMKIMNDHFSLLTNDEKFVDKVQGLTLEGRIYKDRAAWGDSRIAMGKNDCGMSPDVLGC